MSDQMFIGQLRAVRTCLDVHGVRVRAPRLPKGLANRCEWDARIEDVARRLQCSTCGKLQCTARAVEMSAPRGHKNHWSAYPAG